MIVLLSGQIKNIGDFLITDRARKLFEEYVDNEVVILDRTKKLDPHLELINSSKFIVLCGGPAYAPDIYDGIYPLVDDLSQIKVPIIPFGLGWCGRPANDPFGFSFDSKSMTFLKGVHDRIDASSCRDVLTEKIVKSQGFDNVVMTGCPVWYDLPSIKKEFKTPDQVNHIVFTTAANPRLIGQTLKCIRLLSKHFPSARITLSYHRGILPDRHTTIRATAGYLIMALGSFLINSKIKVKDVSYELERLDFYDHCDFHFGYRVHAHLYFLSKRLPSVLINEDGRGQGMVETMGLPILNVGDTDLIAKAEKLLIEYKATNFEPFKYVGHYIDKQFEVMRNFLQNLN